MWGFPTGYAKKIWPIFFFDEDGLIYCNDVNTLMKAVGHKHIASEWRLFIDSNKTSLKGVLFHNGVVKIGEVNCPEMKHKIKR